MVAAHPGDLDPSFGTGGTVTTAFGTSGTSAYAIALQGDGKIVAAGGTGLQDAFALARYNPDGSLDKTFGTGGLVMTGINELAGVNAVAVQEDGKIVVAGSSGGVQGFFTLARYNPDGRLDKTFGAGGPVFGTSGSANALALQGDGKIVAAGSTENTTFALVRYNPDGILDGTFGTGGTVTTAFGTSGSSASAVALQGMGRSSRRVARASTSQALSRSRAT
jgi:uncharacterized delta-60 repeat protein